MPAGSIYDAVMGAYDDQVARDRATQDRKFTVANEDRQNNALNAIVDQYGTQAGAPDTMIAVQGNQRAQTAADAATAADLRERQNGAQRAGLGVARQILQAPPEQQDALIQRYAPMLANAFGTHPEDIVNTINTIRQSPDPQGQLDALDQALEPQAERQLRLTRDSTEDVAAQNNATDIEQARIAAQSRETVASARAHQQSQGSLAAMQAASSIGDQAISNIDEHILPFIDRITANGTRTEGALGANWRHFIEQNLAGMPGRQFRAALDSLKGSLSVNDLRNMRATGVRLGNTTMREFQAAAEALAALDTGQDLADIRPQVQRARAALVIFRNSLNADIEAQQRNAEPAGGLAFPEALPQDAGDGTTPPAAGATPPAAGATPAAPAAGADDLASYLGR